jgi:hypothetical protein
MNETCPKCGCEECQHACDMWFICPYCGEQFRAGYLDDESFFNIVENMQHNNEDCKNETN